MKDQIQFSDSLIIQFAKACVALLISAFIVSIFSSLGIPLYIINIVLIVSILVAAAIFSSNAIVPYTHNVGLIFSIEALSAFGLFGIVGAVFAFGHDGFAVLVGIAAGIVFSLLLVAPRLSEISISSLPDFFVVRYGSRTLRILTLSVTALVCVLFVAAQLVACGLIAVQIFNFDPLVGIFFGAVFIFLLALPLRITVLSKAQLFMALLVFLGGLVVCTLLLAGTTNIIVPHFAYGGLISDAHAAETLLGLNSQSAYPNGNSGYLGTLALISCLAVGTAVMPHMLRRVFAQGSGAISVNVLRTGLIFFVVLATALPALGVLARVEFLALFTQAKNAFPLDAIPPSMLIGAEICGDALDTVASACAAKGYNNGIPTSALSVAPESMLLVLPTLVAASDWLLALLSLTGLSVAILAGVAAVHSFALSLTSQTLPGEAPQIMGIVIVTVTSIAGVVAATSNVGLIHLAAWAYSLIGATLVGPLVLGLWWQRTNAYGAISGFVVGFGLTAIYIFYSHWGLDLQAGSGDEARWLGLSSLMAGAFGIVFSVITTVLVSFVGPKPKPSQLAFLQPNKDLSTTVPEVLE